MTKPLPRHRKGWASLSQPQRRRYERAGIDEKAYAAGIPLTSARGHGRTPERPERAERHPDNYRGYLRRRNNAMRVITTHGVQSVEGLSRSERSTVGSHDNAVRFYLAGGDASTVAIYKSRLSDFEGRTVTGYRLGSDDLETFELETRENALDYLEGRGQLRFTSVYEAGAA